MGQTAVREPAVAGRFYPAEPVALRATVRALLDAAPAPPASSGAAPSAVVVPHAGYVYSGPIAATAYRALGGGVRRVVLVGPSHFVGVTGVALPVATAFRTPLGEHPVDGAAAEALAGRADVERNRAAHRDEHCLEVQLPFLTMALGAVPIVPLVTGAIAPEAMADILDAVWAPDTLVIVSSDLSHYLSYDAARVADRRTAAAIEALDPGAIGPGAACGREAVRGLLVAARRRALTARTLDLRSSGDTAGGRDRVVGYGAFAFA